MFSPTDAWTTAVLKALLLKKPLTLPNADPPDLPPAESPPMTAADHGEVVDLWLADKPPADVPIDLEEMSETEPEAVASTVKQFVRMALKGGLKKAWEWLLHGLDRSVVLLVALGLIHLLKKLLAAVGVSFGH
jgi:hypothetical protein